jgi:spermidine synthase
MSLTPAELMSMRTGLRFANGHTIVAGLGLGHLLIEVTKKKSVKRVTLVEIDQELIAWLYPKIKPHLQQEVEIIVGDANKVIPGLEADAALIDIDSSYGNNRFLAPHQHIHKVWVWGSAAMGGRNSYW